MMRHTQDRLQISANVQIDVYDAVSRALRQRQRVHNLITLSGRNLVRDAIYGDVIDAPNRFALGTSGTAVASSDVALGAEVWRAGFSVKTKSAASITYKYFLTSLTANGNTLREAGLFSDPADVLFARVTFSPVVKTLSVTVLFSWVVSIGAS